MKFIHRLGYYLGGFSIGLIFLAFFLNGKKVSCDYGPQARVLKNINSKKIVFSEKLNTFKIDTSEIKLVIKEGKILFSKSDTRKKPCGEYVIEKSTNEDNDEKLLVTLQNCDSLVKVVGVTKE